MKRFLRFAFLLALPCIAMAGTAEDEAAATKLLNEYLSSFVSLDSQQTSTHFNEPFMLLTAASTNAYATRTDVDAWLKRTFSQLKERGYARSEWAPLRVKALAPGVVIASARTIRYKADGSELEATGATYLLRNSSDGWRIAVLTPHPASMALELK